MTSWESAKKEVLNRLGWRRTEQSCAAFQVTGCCSALLAVVVVSRCRFSHCIFFFFLISIFSHFSICLFL